MVNGESGRIGHLSLDNQSLLDPGNESIAQLRLEMLPRVQSLWFTSRQHCSRYGSIPGNGLFIA